MQAHAIPFKLAIKNNWGTCQKWWGKIGNSISHVGSSLLNMTLSSSCRVGISSFSSFTFLGLATISCLPFYLYHIIMTTDPMDPKVSKLLVASSICSRVVLLQLHLPLILCIIQNHFSSFCLLSMMWETLWPSFDTVFSRRLELIIREVD